MKAQKWVLVKHFDGEPKAEDLELLRAIDQMRTSKFKNKGIEQLKAVQFDPK